MSNSDTNDLATRLRAPPNRKSRKKTLVTTVRENFADIQHARAAGKTWDDIGYDFEPTSPVAGDSVGRTFRRIEAGMQRSLKPAVRKTQPLNRALAPITDLPLLAVVAHDDRPRLFGAAPDPIRQDQDHGGYNADR
jgi:hypothetical protein